MMVASQSIVPIPAGCDFTLHNIPFGVFSKGGSTPRPCSAIGEFIVDLNAVAQAGLFDDTILKTEAPNVFNKETLNDFMALGRPYWRATRSKLQKILTSGESPMEGDDTLRRRVLIPRKDVVMHLPMTIGDYTDFYSSKEHATNVGVMFRGKDNALQPNWYVQIANSPKM